MPSSLMKTVSRLACAALAAAAACGPAAAQSYRDRPPEDEIIYFVLPDRFENADPSNDRGGIDGGPLQHGFDPAHKGFYHGGDLKGLTERLDYIEGLGATAVWLGPIYENKPVQGAPGEESAGYHGYWITDFTRVDPHFGTREDLKAFVDAAHARDMKVYLDIITNHTADVIAYRECHDPDYRADDRTTEGCPYRSLADYPYGTRGGPDAALLNEGFIGDGPAFQTTENFDRLTRADYAYTPFVAEDEAKAKTPAWLNDPVHYHNRGDTHWSGESTTYGDFAGLDDLMTEHPRVVEGMIDIYKMWISQYRIDGFRIDTAKHVNPEFWKAFNAAILDHAAAEGVENFHVFGEAYSPDPAELARRTRVDGFPAVLDFGFQAAVRDVVADGAPGLRLATFFAADALYAGGEAAARALPVFVGNHDMGRFATFVRDAAPGASEEEIIAKVKLAHAMMFFLRGAPVIYYGDEQGFIGDGGDQDAREDMFESRVESYNDNDLLGAGADTSSENFDRTHPLYGAFAAMAGIFKAHEPLRRGRQIIRHAEDADGLFVVSRLAPDGEYLVAFNTQREPRRANVAVDPRSTTWRAVSGACAARSGARGSVSVELAPWSYQICRSNQWSQNR